MNEPTPRIALIHALAHSVEPVNTALARMWPQARVMNLVDDSLSADLARAGALDAAMHQRFQALAAYAIATGAEGILFTCSAFGSCIDAVKRRWPAVPVLKPNEAMVEQASALALSRGTCLGLVASFAPTLQSMPPEFDPAVQLDAELARGALAALGAGDLAAHDTAALAAAQALCERGCGVIALAQFSLARAAPLLRDALPGIPVLTTVDSAIEALRRRVQAGAG